MARVLYTLLLYLLTPLMLLRLALRGLRNRDYLRRWGERFGALARLPESAEVIWLHAVSVGEVNALAPLIEHLLEREPAAMLLLTTGTTTGSARARQLFAARVRHAYLPFDLPGAVRRFLQRAHPSVGVIAETEIWPNLYTLAGRRGVPLLIVNARLSERSMRGFAIVPGVRLIRAALESVVQVLAQSQTDAARYRSLGAPAQRVSVVGNLKFDLTPPRAQQDAGRALRAAQAARPVWIAASTHEAEESAVMKVHQSLLQRWPHGLLLWAPRHPERFRAVEQLARGAGWQVHTRSAAQQPQAATQCFVLDSLGELMQFYAAADVAFVGGSLAAGGGHNVLEPAALGVPVLVGPHTENFAGIVATLRDAGALRQCADAEMLAIALAELLADPGKRGTMSTAGRMVVASGRGALQRIAAAIEAVLAARRGAAVLTSAAR